MQSINVTIMCNVGELTDKKISKLNENLGVIFPNATIAPNQVILQNELGIVNIQLDRIIYTLTNCEKIVDLQDNFYKITDILMIDENIGRNASIVINNLIKTENAFESSISFIKDLETSGFIGAGIRLFFTYESRLCELKLEPYIADPSNYYLEGIYNMNNSIKYILENIFSVWDDFMSRQSSILPK